MGEHPDKCGWLGVDGGRRVGQLGGAVYRHHGGYSGINPPLAVLALDDLMRKLLVVHRLLEAEERLAKREPRTNPL